MIGRTLSHFKITAKLGEGGMGEVYRAEDTKLGREVAIKVLPGDFSADRERLARFEREARSLASLNHPNVATLHSFEQAGGTHFLVMELVEGEDLAERISRGPVAVRTAIPLFIQIAEGLEAAHERGIVHRDLKPSNIKCTEDGRAKVLDFGLAKALTAEGPAADLSQSPTLTVDATRAGTLLGTAAYMSPEQARGSAVDSRSDIWAFGCVMFEILTASRAFHGSTVSDTLAAILKEDPEWSRLPSSTSPALRRLMRWCLRKDARQRLQHIGDARTLLEDIQGAGDQEDDIAWPRRGLAPVLAWAAGLVLFLLGAASMWLAGFREPPRHAPPSAIAWHARPLTATGDAWNVALAPDGQTVAYLTAEGLVTQDVQGGSANLILPASSWSKGFMGRRVGQPSGAPEWLHDGSGVAFTTVIDFTTTHVSAVPRMGGAVTPKLVISFADGQPSGNIDSLPDDGFLFARVLENREAAPWIRLRHGDSTEGVDVPLDIVDLWDAVASPDGQVIAYVGERADRTNVVATISRDGTRHNVLAERGTELSKWTEITTNRQWPMHRILRWPDGNRLYFRQISTRGVDVYAVTLDSSHHKALGDPELVYSGLPPGASFDVAGDGRRLVYSGGVVKTQIHLFRFDAMAGGDPVEDRVITRGTARHVAPRFSPDGQKLAYIRKTGGSDDIYVVPTAGGEAQPVNVLYSWDHLVDLRWSPDGERLAVYALTPNGSQLVVLSLSDFRVRELSTQPLSSTSFAWSPDGAWIAYPSRGDDTHMLHELATGEEREIFEELQGEKILSIFSPDGTELLVNSIGPAGSSLWVGELDGDNVRSVTSGLSLQTVPVHWGQDGTLYFLDGEGRILTVDVSGGTPHEFGRIPETPVIFEGYAAIHIVDGILYLACAVLEPRESDAWVLDRTDEATR